MKNKKNKELNNLKYLKKKKDENIQLDTYINRINQIKTEKTIIEENNIILIFPCYLRKNANYVINLINLNQ